MGEVRCARMSCSQSATSSPGSDSQSADNSFHSEVYAPKYKRHVDTFKAVVTRDLSDNFLDYQWCEWETVSLDDYALRLIWAWSLRAGNNVSKQHPQVRRGRKSEDDGPWDQLGGREKAGRSLGRWIMSSLPSYLFTSRVGCSSSSRWCYWWMNASLVDECCYVCVNVCMYVCVLTSCRCTVQITWASSLAPGIPVYHLFFFLLILIFALVMYESNYQRLILC